MSADRTPRRFNPDPVETSSRTSSGGTRRFAPLPVESSSRSSKQTHKTTENESDTVKRPRKFAVEPVETTHLSSKGHADGAKPDKPRKFAPEPVETSHSSSKEKGKPAEEGKARKFASEPVETSHVSSKDKAGEGKPRRFAPQPVETSHTSSKDHAAASKEGRPRARFAPQLIEASEKTHTSRSPARKFAPQLIETAQRSRRAGDAGPTVLHSERTDATAAEKERRRSPIGKHIGRRSSSDSLEDSPYDRMSMSEEIAECRRLGKPIPKRQDSYASNRSHSFMIPELEPIESSETERSDNEGSDAPSLSTADSIDSSQDDYRRRESVDVSGYFLQLAARTAERQMRDEALAAFPNDDRHDPVDHYIDKDQDDDNEMSDAWSVADRDGSVDRKFVKVNWELRDTQKHAEGKATAKEKERARKEAWRSFQNKTSAHSPWGDAAAALYSSAARAGDVKNMGVGEGMKQMRNSARPPMLGSDIRFPRCPSPEPARFDVTQGAEGNKYLAEHEDGAGYDNYAREIDPNGMWGKKRADEEDEKPALWCQTSRPPTPDKGLWAGCCVGGTGLTPPRGPTGLMTPFVREDDPFDVAAHQHGTHQLPPSPPPSNSGGSSNNLEDKLRLEQAIDAEFGDAFVSQVYNYLSLGYPSMARKFDAELAKISRMDVAVLRQDDAIAGSGARGYIRFGEENGMTVVDSDGGEVKEHHCARWRALKLYVREWARQQPSWHEYNRDGWGTAARRGSWAW